MGDFDFSWTVKSFINWLFLVSTLFCVLTIPLLTITASSVLNDAILHISGYGICAYYQSKNSLSYPHSSGIPRGQLIMNFVK